MGPHANTNNGDFSNVFSEGYALCTEFSNNPFGKGKGLLAFCFRDGERYICCLSITAYILNNHINNNIRLCDCLKEFCCNPWPVMDCCHCYLCLVFVIGNS